MTATIKLDGRQFAGITQSLTANQDDYILAHLRLAGAISVLSDLDGVRRTQEKRAEDLLTHILLSGHAQFILAGCLTEEGHVWNRAEADANAARFSQITDEEEKIAMRSSIVKFVIGFFALGETSSETSQKSSSPSAEVPPTENAARAASETSTD
ncbi:MAG: hypothetical protein WAN12_18875 [Candidatus Acidiferrum sp.]